MTPDPEPRPPSREELDRLEEQMLARRQPEIERRSAQAMRRSALAIATAVLLAIALWWALR